ncbi:MULTISPECIES: hypothetical protein [unclassified Streptomyces]|uniref:Uncharacterized protein n=1 Tax=Streptomyces sp. NBC_00119 TaxID=2975659 RepID=A0AAU1UAR1_9ACTN|nr:MULTISPECIES: hypothetical protein [unclassified Streptomyces]MCX4644753.1 hypothetical protein [Streptomyces sp. NBC_01446]MCX5326592.1 hypothetical protein [Streptomyces sp. NBC_00120]
MTGPEFKARVRLLDEDGEEAKHAAKLLRHKHPVMHGVAVPPAHKVQRDRTLHYEVRVLEE